MDSINWLDLTIIIIASLFFVFAIVNRVCMCFEHKFDSDSYVSSHSGISALVNNRVDSDDD